MNRENIGIIILAAGASSRLGQPKQLLQFQGRSLLQHSLDAAIGAEPGIVILVLGANAPGIIAAIGKQTVDVIVNNDWEEGIASSIRHGIKALMNAMPSAEAAILMLCDQPYVTSALLNELIVVHSTTGKPIVASRYNDTAGVPALFHKDIFPQLLQLTGDVGARGIIKQHIKDTETILFEKGEVDIDTSTDYLTLEK